MFLTTKARLKIVDNEKLHISRRPGTAAWLFLGLSVLVFVELCRRLSENVFVSTVLIFGDIMFVLDTLGDWEDFVLDKVANKATFRRSSWSDKLCLGSAGEKSVVTMELSKIRHVGVSMTLGLFVLLKNELNVSINCRRIITIACSYRQTRTMKSSILLEKRKINRMYKDMLE
ncbi:uncharacterized protein LOC124302257 isoform X2 [Neodiprion virginianus]|uniref:uncharacterized protein LOC124181369 isoform X2 n=1 Tax=Neodiprion fabricii TaxID=2872261 RepID=UPI001ED92ACE|nr:uncharacterized protein LOC124181369 isoform X2 [Neodiprion fabricii]XP_046614164.1 uncharacterized protein LOC124302257 isoform X2 [Neodiprion virginianus]